MIPAMPWAAAIVLGAIVSPPARLNLGQIEARQNNADVPESTLARLQRAAVAAQRAALDDLRGRELIGDHAFHAVEAEIDVLDLTADSRIRPDESSGPAST